MVERHFLKVLEEQTGKNGEGANMQTNIICKSVRLTWIAQPVQSATEEQEKFGKAV